MFNNKEFKVALLRRGKSVENVAAEIGINVVTLYRKMNGASDFYRDEMQNISIYLNLTAEEREKIFFNQNITDTQ